MFEEEDNVQAPNAQVEGEESGSSDGSDERLEQELRYHDAPLESLERDQGIPACWARTLADDCNSSVQPWKWSPVCNSQSVVTSQWENGFS
ncbi:hypothetical protein PCANC_01701 [Puccinia coronata f. sp. avenae]|uniref:Uncharacterized protein n=1 Tax=Puccinia coronata f. sp. avenae TaxID=200324 RepID=A0A2N5W3G7_9BASI|nr:hypothetical protein PCANC_01701 [Puccinia coronata f. sp. avenae]